MIGPMWAYEGYSVLGEKDVEISSGGVGGNIKYVADRTNNLVAIMADNFPHRYEPMYNEPELGDENVAHLIDMKAEKLILLSIPLKEEILSFQDISISTGKVILGSSSKKKNITYLDCYDVNSQQLLKRRIFPELLVKYIASNEDTIAIATKSGRLLVLDLKTLDTRYDILAFPDIYGGALKVTGLYIHNGKVISSTNAGELYAVDLKEGRSEGSLDDIGTTVAFDGDWMVGSCLSMSAVKLWNLKTGFFVQKEMPAHVTALSFRQRSAEELPCLIAGLSDGRVWVSYPFQGNQVQDNQGLQPNFDPEIDPASQIKLDPEINPIEAVAKFVENLVSNVFLGLRPGL